MINSIQWTRGETLVYVSQPLFEFPPPLGKLAAKAYLHFSFLFFSIRTLLEALRIWFTEIYFFPPLRARTYSAGTNC
jgi:hypothetical protein